MVSFVCDVCQETFKKPKLDQHYSSCGGQVSCVDCSTTFHGTSFRAHTSCISEAEKYQKSLYKGPKSKQAAQTPAQTPATTITANGNGNGKAHEMNGGDKDKDSKEKDKKLSKEEKKKLKAEKKKADKMDVDKEEEAIPEPAVAAEEPVAEKKLSKEEKKKLKAEKKSSKEESKTEESNLPESLGAQLRKLEATRAEGKDGSGVSDLAAAAHAAGLSADHVNETPVEATKEESGEKSKKKDKKRDREEKVEEEKAKSPEPEKKKAKKDKAAAAAAAEEQEPLAQVLTKKALEIVAKGTQDLATLKKEINDSFGTKEARKAAGYNQEVFDKTAQVTVKDGALVLTFA